MFFIVGGEKSVLPNTDRWNLFLFENADDFLIIITVLFILHFFLKKKYTRFQCLFIFSQGQYTTRFLLQGLGLYLFSAMEWCPLENY